MVERENASNDRFLANVYFTCDPHSPTYRQAWDDGIRAVSDELRIANPVRYSASMFLKGAWQRSCKRKRVKV
jgi:hypothetical protein